jgi:hypothetical protein
MEQPKIYYNYFPQYLKWCKRNSYDPDRVESRDFYRAVAKCEPINLNSPKK